MDDTYTTLNGRTLKLSGVASSIAQKAMRAVEKEFRARGEPIDPPTYETSIGEVIAWTAESVEKDGKEEDKAAWKAYVEAKRRLKDARDLRVMQIQLYKGIQPEDREPTQEWLDEQRILGFEVPEDPVKRAISYLEDEVLTGPAEIMEVLARISLLSVKGAVTEEDAADLEATFQSALDEVRGEVMAQFRANTPEAGAGEQE